MPIIDTRLTKREKEIIRMTAEEKSVPEIANILRISESTVEWEKKNLRDRFEVKSTVGLVYLSAKFGII